MDFKRAHDIFLKDWESEKRKKNILKISEMNNVSQSIIYDSLGESVTIQSEVNFISGKEKSF